MHLDFTRSSRRSAKRSASTTSVSSRPSCGRRSTRNARGGRPGLSPGGGPHGADGWLGIGWPKEYGGQGRTPLEQFIFWDETYRARAPSPSSRQHRRPTIMEFGPRRKGRSPAEDRAGRALLRHRLHRASAGTDLASLKTRAVRQGDEYVIDGQKI